METLLPGFMQFVQSVPVAEVLATEGNIQVSRVTWPPLKTRDCISLILFLFIFSSKQSFFRKHAPSEKGPYGISSEVMDTYVKSCGKKPRRSFCFFPCWLKSVIPLMSLPLCLCSGLLRHHLHPGGWRQTPGQPSSDKDRSGGSPIRCNLFFFRFLLKSAFPVFFQESSSTSTLATSWVATPNRCLHPWNWVKRWWRAWEACRASSIRSSGSSATPPFYTCAGKWAANEWI